MASAYLLSAAPRDPVRRPKAFLDLDQLRDSARADSFGVHSLAEDAASADLILFVETDGGAGHYFHRIRSHPLYRRHRDKSYVFAAEDVVVPLLPGVFAGIERAWYREAWTRSGFYPGVKETPQMHYAPGSRPTKLFSFVGAANAHPVRERIMSLPAGDGVLVDSHAEADAIKRGEIEPVPDEEFVGRYVQSIQDCAFVLCPRGGGTSSFRLFEAMMLGRVPVIISDEWVAPTGPDWESFSLRVPESDVEEIPEALASCRGRAAGMGGIARETWEGWFSPQAGFHRTVEWCLDLARHGAKRRGPSRLLPYRQMLQPYHAARAVAKRVGEGR